MTIPRGDGPPGRMPIAGPCVTSGGEDIELLGSEATDPGDNVRPLEEVDRVHEQAMVLLSSSRLSEAIERSNVVISPAQHDGSAARFFVALPTEHPWFSSVGFINQGNTTLTEARAQATHLFSICASPIDVIYNSAPFGWSSRDISEESDSVRLLRRSWDAYFENSGSSISLRMQFCAGDAVFIVQAALRGYEYAHRIYVIAAAPSGRIDPETCFCVRHYRTTADFTSMSCCIPGSESPESSTISRSDHDRGVFDNCFAATGFMEFLRLEGLCFNVRQVLLEARILPPGFDLEVERLRERFLEDGILGGHHQRVFSEIQRVHRQRAELARFLSRYGGPEVITSMDNLVEGALDEFPRDCFERVLAAIDFLRDSILVVGGAVVVYQFRQGTSNLSAALGIPGLELLNIARLLGVYIIRRAQDSPSYWRSWALQGSILSIICWLYEAGFACHLLVSQDAPGFFRVGLGVYVVCTGLNALFDTTFRLYSPLRGRIQDWLTVVSEEDIGTERNENEVVRNLGLIERLFRGVHQLGRGAIAIGVAAVLVYPIVAPLMSGSSSNSALEDNSNMNTTQHNMTISSRDSETSNVDILSVVSVGAIALVSVGSFVANILQVRRMFRNLRGADIEENPLIEAEPGSTHESRRARRLNIDLPDVQGADQEHPIERGIPRVSHDNRNSGDSRGANPEEGSTEALIVGGSGSTNDSIGDLEHDYGRNGIEDNKD